MSTKKTLKILMDEMGVQVLPYVKSTISAGSPEQNIFYKIDRLNLQVNLLREDLTNIYEVIEIMRDALDAVNEHLNIELEHRPAGYTVVAKKPRSVK